MFSAIVLSFGLLGADPTLAGLVEANSSSVALIRTLDVVYDHDLQPLGQGRTAREHWIRAENREHFWSAAAYIGAAQDGRPKNLREWVLNDNEYRLLLNWDAQNPQPIRPVFQGTLRAEIGPVSDRNPTGINPAYKLLFEVEQYPRRTLAHLVSSAARSEVIGRDRLGQRDCWLIRVTTAPEPRVRTIDLWLDPAAGFMVAQRVERDPQFDNPGGDPGLATSFTVAEFQDCGDGVYLPLRSEVRGCVGGQADPLQAPISAEIRLVSWEVNAPIDDSQFQLDFPKYAAVQILPIKHGRSEVAIWGDTGPIARVHSLEEIESLEAKLMRDPAVQTELALVAFPTLRPPGGTGKLVYVVVGAITLVATAIVFWRLRPGS